MWFSPREEENGGRNSEPQSSHRLRALLLSRVRRAKDVVLCGLHLPTCPCPCPDRKNSTWVLGQLSWLRTMPRLLCPLLQLSFLEFHESSCPITGPAHPSPLLSCSRARSGLPCRSCGWWRDGIVRLSFLPGPRPGWQCSGSTRSASPLPGGWHLGPSSKRPTAEPICAWEI